MPTGLSPNPVRGPNPNGEFFAFSFRPNGSSALSSSTNVGAGFSVVRTSDGKWTVTVNAIFKDTPVVVAFLQTNAAPTGAADLRVAGAITMASGVTTFALEYRDAAVATDLASSANTRIHVMLFGAT